MEEIKEINSEDLIKVSEAVKLLPTKVHPRTFRRWCEEGKYGIVVYRFGNQIRIDKNTLPKLEIYL